jgi:hypothetical protein
MHAGDQEYSKSGGDCSTGHVIPYVREVFNVPQAAMHASHLARVRLDRQIPV